MRGRGQGSGDGARLNPSLRRGRLKSREEACHLRADSGPSGSAGLGAGPGSCWALAAAPKSVSGGLGPAGWRGGWRPASATGAAASGCAAM
ncbi:hypothetical protein NDU88_006937 [Pleurodeles waltl]|uniref:Uncharacterized protein n=1 Tax=Pleurodeles waltl TaxID=8319 RepID=A0AAV7RTB5_PLEWA|nr:hypothetical protein NDU88_006937 [Pleurodeles waltl]